MRLLDTFCGGGGAGMGYHRAGFEVVGVDIHPQKNYPFEFHQVDAIEYILKHGHEFDVIHASPPCQRHSQMQNIHKNHDKHPDLIEPTRTALTRAGKLFVIENVIGAPLINPIMLCGTMFELRIIRHRLFEANFLLPLLTMTCNHSNVFDPFHGAGRTADKWRTAMDIDWLPMGGGSNKSGTIDEAIPPAYTEFIGRAIMDAGA